MFQPPTLESQMVGVFGTSEILSDVVLQGNQFQSEAQHAGMNADYGESSNISVQSSILSDTNNDVHPDDQLSSSQPAVPLENNTEESRDDAQLEPQSTNEPEALPVEILQDVQIEVEYSDAQTEAQPEAQPEALLEVQPEARLEAQPEARLEAQPGDMPEALPYLCTLCGQHYVRRVQLEKHLHDHLSKLSQNQKTKRTRPKWSGR